MTKRRDAPPVESPSVTVEVEEPVEIPDTPAVLAASPTAPAAAPGAVHTSYGDVDPRVLRDASPQSVADYYFAQTNPRFRALPPADARAKRMLVDLLTYYRDYLTKR